MFISAKYLGYTLVQGGDLTVREGKVCLKTLNGLQHVDVILRRINDNDCDPLELNQYSYVGVAGLLQSLRLGSVAVANPLGSSILENSGLLAFLPKLARYFLGEDLLINSPQTWWCGDKKSRDYVLANLDNLLVKQTIRNVNSTTIRSKLLSSKQRELLTEQILKHPHRYVGTEEINHSSVPIFSNSRLESRPVAMRTFITSTETGYMVMPGGLARVVTGRDSPVSSTRSIRISKDIWITASAPETISILSPTVKQSRHIVFEGQNELPSRVAENLFWLGRYAERAEGTIRLLRTVLLYLADPYDFPSQVQQSSAHNLLHNLLRAVTHITETYPGFVGEGAAERLVAPEDELRSIFLDKDRVGGLSSTLQFLVNVAGSIRERVSPDIWRVINRIDEQLQRLQGETKVDILPELDELITALAAFSGLSIESMTHGQGWKFLIIGRRIERGQHLVSLLKTILCNVNEDDTAMMEHLLGITDSLLTYRRRYRSQPEAYAVLELILQNERNPHAIGYQLERIERYIRELPGNTQIYCSPMGKILLEALTLIRLADMDALAQVTTDPVAGDFRKELEQLLTKVGDLLVHLSDIVSNSYFTHAEVQRQLVKLGSETQDI
ncbi:MAG: circularly permuted type 2 ATP-grasp protein [Thiotrichaceae bacterium]